MGEQVKGCRINTQGLYLLDKIVNQQSLFLLYILAEANKDGIIDLNANIKTRIFKKIGSKAKDPSSTMKQYLAMYCKANVLTSMGKGSYRINPEVSTLHRSYSHFITKASKEYRAFKIKKELGIKERRAGHETKG